MKQIAGTSDNIDCSLNCLHTLVLYLMGHMYLPKRLDTTSTTDCESRSVQQTERSILKIIPSRDFTELLQITTLEGGSERILPLSCGFAEIGHISHESYHNSYTCCLWVTGGCRE